MIDLSAEELIFPLGETGDCMIWQWEGPFGELMPWYHMSVTLKDVTNGREFVIYPTTPCESFSGDFILDLNTLLEGVDPLWRHVDSDPGRLYCLALMGLIGGGHPKRWKWLSGACQVGYLNVGCPSSPTGAISAWLYPEDGAYTFSITTTIIPLCYPDLSDEEALVESVKCYAKRYEVLYRQRLTRAVLEQWREQVRAFLKHIFAQGEYQLDVP